MPLRSFVADRRRELLPVATTSESTPVISSLCTSFDLTSHDATHTVHLPSGPCLASVTAVDSRMWRMSPKCAAYCSRYLAYSAFELYFMPWSGGGKSLKAMK